MNILYGIQGTGHGHISRAKELLPELGKHASVDVLISGYASQLELEGDIKYRKRGISFSYDRKGGVSLLNTIQAMKPIRFLNDVHSIPLSEYDLVISDYEPVTAWAAKSRGIPTVAMSHQAAYLSKKSPRPPKKSKVAEAILQHFAPADQAVGFHFNRYDTFIEPPIIRSEIRSLIPSNQNHITVYLPAFHHTELVHIFSAIRNINWHIFAPSCTSCQSRDHITVFPVSNQDFLDSFGSCRGVFTSAGFETSAEAMYLNKKLMVIPINNQYEQRCNAAAMQEMGIKILSDLQNIEADIQEWLSEDRLPVLEEIADPSRIIDTLLNNDEALFNKRKQKGKPAGILS